MKMSYLKNTDNQYVKYAYLIGNIPIPTSECARKLVTDTERHKGIPNMRGLVKLTGELNNLRVASIRQIFGCQL